MEFRGIHATKFICRRVPCARVIIEIQNVTIIQQRQQWQTRMSTTELEDMDEKQRVKNRARLLTQNKKLNNQIRNLEKEIGEIVTARQSQMIRSYEQSNAQLAKHREEIAMQEKYMKQLKAKIDFLKSANTKGNAQFIVKEEDDLLLLKKEYEALLVEKSVVSRFKDDKLKVLDKDKPFEDHKKEVEESLAAVRKSNRTMQAEITELEREARKFHNYIVLNNTLGREKKETSSLQYEIAKNEHEIKQIQSRTKEIEDKWKSQLDGLDKELFELKSAFSKTEARLNEIEKEHRMWETRKNGLRYEEEILEFRDRLSKIQLLPEEKQFDNTIKSEQKKEKLTASELIKLRKSKNASPVKEETNKSQKNEKDEKQKDIPETKSEQAIHQSAQEPSKNKGLARHSDKNIISPPVQTDKGKDKQKGKEKQQAKQKQKRVESKQIKQKADDKKEKGNQEIKQEKGKEKGKEKEGIKKQPQIKQTNKASIPGKNEKDGPKNQIKSQKAKNKNERVNESKDLGKQKSEAQLGKSKQKEKKKEKEKEKASPPKNQQKVKTQDQRVQAEVKQVSPKKNESSPKQREGSPKMGKEGEKKAAKLILKSVGVGTS